MSSGKAQIDISNKYDRVVVLVDMDCFYCQVEEKLNPELKGKPIAVVQYNAWRGGGIIAVNYPARAEGVTRHMRGDEAKENCPDIILVKVPNVREKADLTKYREAGKEVASVLQTFTTLLERASVDEAYMDITEQVNERLNIMNEGRFQLKPSELTNTYSVGYDNIGQYIQEISSRIENDVDDLECEEDDKEAFRKSDIKLLIGASIVNEIRAKVKEKTGYECSAGIASNKILAKLACGINKPNKQTILPLRQIYALFSTLPVSKIKGLGAKFGEEVCERLNIKFLGDLLAFSEKELQRKFDEKSGTWLHLIARGIDLEAVTPRFYSKSIGCCKKFPGMNAITGIATLNHWFNELANEICDRLDKDIVENNRRAKQMVISFIQEINGEDISSSRSTTLPSYEPEAIAKEAFDVLKRNTERFFKPNNQQTVNNPIKFLGISAGKFESIETSKNTLQEMFANQVKKKKLESNTLRPEIKDNPMSSMQVNNKNVQKEIDQSSVKKSFFANHFKKQSDLIFTNNNDLKSAQDSSRSNDGQNLEEKQKGNTFILNDAKIDSSTTNTATVKSFFINATKNVPKNQNGTFIAAKEPADLGLPSTLPSKGTINISNEYIEDRSNDESVSNANDSISHIRSPSPVPSANTSNVSNEYVELKSNQPSISNAIESKSFEECDYKNSYAEFIVPEPTTNDYVTCEKCNKQILCYSFQSHMDFHFAFELSQEQREEFRKEFKTKLSSPTPAKKQKTSRSNSSNKTKANNESLLQKFLTKSTPPLYESVEGTSTEIQNREKCAECGLFIEISIMLEHMDYHAARKLQAEINRPQIKINSPSTPSGKKAMKSVEKSKGKSITAFFVSQS